MKLMTRKEWEEGHEIYRQVIGDDGREMMEKDVSFEILDNGSYASIVKSRSRFDYPWIIFPENFLPLEGYEYTCQVYYTFTGSFIYRGERYRVARAYLDTLTYENYLAKYKMSVDDKPATLGDLLKKAMRK